MDSYTYGKLLQCGVDEKRVTQMDLSEVDLSHQSLVAVDLKGFLLNKANFESADLSGADLRGQEFAASNCVCAAFVGADLRGANLAFGYFNNADFRGADLRGARLANALCSESNFCGTDLRGAHIGSEHYNSDFRGADLRGVIVPEGCEFERLNCDTQGALRTPKKAVSDGNKRKLPRVKPLHDLRVYEHPSRRPLGSIIDISMGGFGVTSRDATAVDRVYLLEVLLPEGCTYGQTFKVEAKSVWCRHDPHTSWFNSGFKIERISQQDHRVIEYLMKEHEVLRKWAQEHGGEVPVGVAVGQGGR